MKEHQLKTIIRGDCTVDLGGLPVNPGDEVLVIVRLADEVETPKPTIQFPLAGPYDSSIRSHPSPMKIGKSYDDPSAHSHLGVAHPRRKSYVNQ